jgi:Protein of unknown function (DUF2752)
MQMFLLKISFEDYMLPCLSKQLFDLECFGCGLQRSTYLLFHGEFIAAYKMYPAIYPLITLFVFIGINFFFKFKHSNKIINILAILTITTIVISYLIKITN